MLKIDDKLNILLYNVHGLKSSRKRKELKILHTFGKNLVIMELNIYRKRILRKIPLVNTWIISEGCGFFTLNHKFTGYNDSLSQKQKIEMEKNK